MPGNIWCSVSMLACRAWAVERSISAVRAERLKVGSEVGSCEGVELGSNRRKSVLVLRPGAETHLRLWS